MGSIWMDLGMIFIVLLAVLLAGALATVAWISIRLNLSTWLTARRESQGLCPGCGYDIRHSPIRCPECGRFVYAWTKTHHRRVIDGCAVCLMILAAIGALLAFLSWANAR